MTQQLPGLDLLAGSDESRDEFDLEPLACPGVFYPTLAADGVLSRIRTPGGLVTATQCRLVAEIADAFANGVVTVTNRANLQLRALTEQLPGDVLVRMQRAGLASMQPSMDHLRNIMTSPAAGLDADAVLDTRPLVRAFDAYLAEHVELARLPAKFSVGFDGGEHASIASQPNDILFRAYRTSGTGAEARLRVVVRAGHDDGEPIDLGFAVRPGQTTEVAATIAHFYLDALPADGPGPRLRHVIAELGIPALRAAILERLPDLASDGAALPAPTEAPRAPIGAHAQRDTQCDEGVTYVGLAPFLGGLSGEQLRALADLADRFGSGALRLTPWRSVVIPDVTAESVDALQDALEVLGLPAGASATSGIVACAGSAGCGAGATDTVRDAQHLAAALGAQGTSALNVHLTGCGKCCAQRRPADVSLLGRVGATESYDIFVRGEGDPRLGRLLFEDVPAAQAIAIAARLADGFAAAGGTSFRAFVEGRTAAELALLRD